VKDNIGLSCLISSITVMDMKSYYLSLCKGLLVTFFFLLVNACSTLQQATGFKDPFNHQLIQGWSWIREHSGHWRMTPDALEIRVEPGNMWGPPNNAKNILVRDLPNLESKSWQIGVTMFNQPTEQYEQVDLVWYYDDSHMVKIGQELVDGQLSVVMGREEGDRTRTIAIIPLDSDKLRVKFEVEGKSIRGFFKTQGSNVWVLVGETDLPVFGIPKITIQCYQGPLNEERWARIQDFEMTELLSKKDKTHIIYP
jgi:regulation of enolase protein 1 (concanavalin A-like superfamily)